MTGEDQFAQQMQGAGFSQQGVVLDVGNVVPINSNKRFATMSFLLIFSCFLGLQSFSAKALAQTAGQALLTPEALFHRCYAHFTRSRALPNNALLLEVKSGAKKAVDACMELLDKASFNANGLLKDTNNKESLLVLDTFQNFHRGWFLEKDTGNGPQTYSNGENRHNDGAEPAAFLSRLLFAPGAQFKDVVTGNYSVRSTRSQGSWVTIAGVGYEKPTQLSNPKSGVQRGKLFGVAPWPANENGSWFDDVGKIVTTVTYDYGRGQGNPLRSYGGGIMGLSSFIWMNSGFANTGGEENLNEPESAIGVANGSIRTHRRWARNIVHDLMCRDLPVLRRSDVSTFVSEYNAKFPNAATHLPFRENTVCMSCHGTVDSMAAAIRNFSFYNANYYDWNGTGGYQDPEDRTAWIKPHPVNAPADPQPLHLTHRDASFYNRPPQANLRYRSYDGSLVDLKISATTDNTSGVKNLGNSMSGLNDIYVCAAARYFEYFTGVKANLQDGLDPSAPIPAQDLAYRNRVINWGLALKDHQSLRELVRQIITSDIYQKKAMRDLAP